MVSAAGQHPDALADEHLLQQRGGLGLAGRAPAGRRAARSSRAPRSGRRPGRARSRSGRRRARRASRAARWPAAPRGWSSTACPSSPSTGGAAGRVPGLSTTPRSAVTVRVEPSGSSTVDAAGPGEAAGAVQHRRRRRPRAGVRRRCRPSRSVASLADAARRPAPSSAVTLTSPASGRGAAGLGQGVGGAHHHLRRDAAVVGALAADQVLVERRGPRARPGRRRWRAPRRRGRAR